MLAIGRVESRFGDGEGVSAFQTLWIEYFAEDASKKITTGFG
jgi:hypothetical protein